ncbi:MAG: xanthine dehydrogenase family protein subunit M [Desulfobacterales bacterium]|nr:MAG: xanthine dehydrogenase family protein subunit M [Desulfobacterales bacterium]
MTKRFEYLRPSTPKEACELKAQNGKLARFLAGGTDLLLDWRRGKTDFKYCIDLTFISDLKYIKQTPNEVSIGTLTTLASLENANKGNGLTAALSNTASQMCTPQIRSFATVGGNLCNASPASDLPVMFMALDGQVKILGVSGERTIALEDFFKGVNGTALKEDEMLTEIIVPKPALKTASAYRRATRLVVDCNQTNVAVSLSADDAGVVKEARIVLGAVAPVPMRAKAAEKMLLNLEVSKIDKELLEKTSSQASLETKPISDLRASADYRREISRVLVRRCIEESIQKLGGLK